VQEEALVDTGTSVSIGGRDLVVWPETLEDSRIKDQRGKNPIMVKERRMEAKLRKCFN